MTIYELALRVYQHTLPALQCEREAQIAAFLSAQQRQRVTVETLEAEIRALREAKDLA